MMATISGVAGLSKRYTNHCIRTSATCILDRAGFEARHIMKISGQQSEASMNSYVHELDEEKYQSMSLAFCQASLGDSSLESPPAMSAPSATMSVPPPRSAPSATVSVPPPEPRSVPSATVSAAPSNPPEPYQGALVPASQEIFPDLLADINWDDFGQLDLPQQNVGYHNQNVEFRRNDWVNFNPSFNNCSVNITFNTTK